jgi:lipopolysaccharide export system protein LptA
MIIRRRLGSSLRATLRLATLATVTLLLATPLEAQTLTNSFGGLTQSSKEPIDIESDVLVVHDQQKYATFKGNVKAVQGTTTLRAQQLDVHYVGGGDKLATGEATPTVATTGAAANEAAAQGAAGDKPAGASADQQAQITKIEAKGNVIITSDQDQTTTSDWALYDVPAQLVTVGGNVVLTQGQNVLKGDRLVIDLKTGESRFENPGNTAAGGRIRALFVPKEGAKDAKTNGKSSDTKPGEAKPSAKATDGGSGEAAAGAETPDAGPTAATDSGDAEPQPSKPPAQDDKPWSLIPGVAQ